jgi:hypothetical protein
VEDLINISNYCDAMLVKHGQMITKCSALYIKEDDVIEFRMQYHTDHNKNNKTYQYQIDSVNFMITDVEVLVNKETIDKINHEISNRLNLMKIKYEV